MTTELTEIGKASPRLPLEPGAGRMTHYRWIVLGLVFLGTTVNYADRMVIAILAPDLQSQYTISDAQYGYINAVFGLAYAFGQLLSGGILDKIGTRLGYALALAGWSVCAMLTALGRGALSFGIFRGMLGFTEAPAFPAAAKACAEWFPRRQRAFAFGFVNAGTNMGAILAPWIVPILATNYGWEWAFIVTGGLGFVVLALWIPLYRRPADHPSISQAELAFIHSDPPEPESAAIPGVLDLRPFSFRGRIDAATCTGIVVVLGLLAIGVGPLVAITVRETRGTAAQPVGLAVLAASLGLAAWIIVSTILQRRNDIAARKIGSAEPAPVTNLVGHRRAWVFAMGKFITDPMWGFYILWLGKFLHDNYNVDTRHIGPPLIAIYVMSDLGSIAGGWLSSTMIRRGYSVNRARKTAFFVSALLVVPIVLAPQVNSLWTAVFILGLATAGHQAFSSNLYTLCSDLFPKRAVASVAGFGGTFGWIGVSLFQAFIGLWVNYYHNYWGPFVAAAAAYLVAFGVIHLLAPRLGPPAGSEGGGFEASAVGPSD